MPFSHLPLPTHLGHLYKQVPFSYCWHAPLGIVYDVRGVAAAVSSATSRPADLLTTATSRVGREYTLGAMGIETPRVTVTPEAEMDLRRLPTRDLKIVSDVLKEPLPTKADPAKGILAVGDKGLLGRIVERTKPSDIYLRSPTETKESDTENKLIIVYQPVSEKIFNVTRVVDENTIQVSYKGFQKK
jgi:hypothetical protein